MLDLVIEKYFNFMNIYLCNSELMGYEELRFSEIWS